MTDDLPEIPRALRRAADEAARDGTQRLLSRLCRELRRRAHLDRDHPATVLCLGDGEDRGWLSSRLPFPARWVDVDPGADALTQALQDAGDAPAFVTATGVVDRWHAARLDAVADVLTARGVPALFSLMPDGSATFVPGSDGDGLLLEAAHAHTTSSGALGRRAASRLELRMRASGTQVVDAATPWRLTAGQAPLLEAYLTRTADAAVRHDPGLRGHASTWLSTRRAQLDDGHLAVAVGHIDLLLVPWVDALPHRH